MEIKSRNRILILLILALVTLVTTSLLVYRQKTLRLLSTMLLKNISEDQSVYITALQTKFDDQLNMLEAQARYFSDIDLKDDEALKRTISTTRGIGDFKKIAVANKEGTCTSYEGKNLPNIYNKSYFLDTIKTGLPQISNRIEVDENLEPILTLTYPIKRKSSVEAVIIGTLSYDVLKKLFADSIFSGESYMYIISSDGNIILCNRNQKRNLYNVNIYDLVVNNAKYGEDIIISKMKSDIMKNQSAAMKFNAKDTAKLFTYSPLGINNWYIISVVPYSYIIQQQSAITFWVYVLLGIIAFTISTFILVLIALFRMTTSIEKDNQRLITATNQNQTLIFEHDIPKGELVFSGDTQFILGTDRKIFPTDLVRTEYYKRIHPDDKSVMTQLRESVEKNIPDFSGEFRYKSFENANKYIWLRISGSLIISEKGKNFIGTISNVNSQILHEQELKSIAEKDKLTGLLNKSTMEQHARQVFSTGGNKEQKCALFILDLDNFKKVNDMLGHLIGDMAIVDAGKKLSLIFSEKDYISRFGGDEFCILMRFSKKLTDEEVKHIVLEKAQNLCTFLREDYSDDSTAISVSASVGIAFYPDNGSTYEELFEAADSALYEVKKNGKNGFKIFEKKE